MKKLQQENKIILLLIIYYETITFCGKNEELLPKDYDNSGSNKKPQKRWQISCLIFILEMQIKNTSINSYLSLMIQNKIINISEQWIQKMLLHIR